jgi:hypothetical protein
MRVTEKRLAERKSMRQKLRRAALWIFGFTVIAALAAAADGWKAFGKAASGVTMIETGQYHSAWPDWHIGPEQAVTAHRMLRGKVMLPIHWGLFTLAYHGWTEPAERVSVAADSATVTLVLPKPGQSVEPSAPPVRERWWPDLPWATAAQHPIVSSKVD